MPESGERSTIDAAGLLGPGVFIGAIVFFIGEAVLHAAVGWFLELYGTGTVVYLVINAIAAGVLTIVGVIIYNMIATRGGYIDTGEE